MKLLLRIGFSILACLPAFSQTALSTIYDRDRQVKLQGSVTRIEWVNPQAYVFLEVRDSAGTLTSWAVDIGNPLDLEREGWKQSSIQVGDTLTVEGVPARSEARQVLASSVVAAASGKRLFTIPAHRATAAAAPAPRWPDGRVRLGPPQGKKGHWVTTNSKAMVENTGAKISMNDDGLLINLSDMDRVAPFQPWAKAIYEHRQRTLLTDDPLTRCLPPGGPRQFQMPNGFQFVEQRELGRVLVLLGGGDRNWRIIYTDGRPPVQGAEAVLGYYGTSVGHWEKDTLVVESSGFNERFWMANGGLPHTEALQLTERFTRSDLNTMRYQVRIDDPRTYTRPWNAAWTFQWVPDKDIEEFFCEENAESTFDR
jgi:hypothetical protein